MHATTFHNIVVSARSADILSSRCMYVCLLTPEFVPHGSRLLPRFPNRNNMAARMSGMAEGPATGEISYTLLRYPRKSTEMKSEIKKSREKSVNFVSS